MYSKSVVLGTAAWLSLLPSLASADAFLYEPFDYFAGANGTNGGSGGIGWSAPWVPQPSSTETGVDVVSSGLTYNVSGGELKSGGNLAFIDGPANSSRNITPISPAVTTLYFSFIAKETNDQTLRRYLNVCFFAGDTEKISIGHTSTMPTPSWSVSLNTNQAVAETGIPTTSQALIVVKVEINAVGSQERASIFVNPPLGAEPASATATTTLDALDSFADLTRVRIASGGQDESNGVTRPRADGFVDELRGGLSWADVTTTGSAGPQVIPQAASVTGASSGVFTFLDSAGGTVDLTRGSAFQLTLSQNGGAPLAATLTPTKTSGVTSVAFTAPMAGGIYDYAITIPVNGISGISTKTVTGRFSSFSVPTDLPGPAGTVGTWGIREYASAENAAYSLAASLAIINAGGPFVDGSAPVFNHSDPDTNGATSSGNFNNDFPILSNAAGTNENFVVVGKTKVTVPAAGDYTFSVHSDDGFGMRVTGGSFISRSGGATIDPKDPQTMLGDFTGPDSNARAVYHFNAAGTYDITYLGYDNSGGGYYEVAWAFGAFAEDRDTNTWSLVGSPNDPSIPAFRPRFAATFPGPLGTAGNFGIRTYYTGTVGSFDAMINFLGNNPPEPGADPNINTVDVQRKYLNASDPNNRGNTGFAPDDDTIPGDTGNDDSNVVTSAKGRISVATAGVYTFNIQADDGYLFRLKGVGATPNPSFRRLIGNGTLQMSNPNEFFAGGDGNLRGVVSLIAGSYDIEFLHYENSGGFNYELSSAAGDHGNDLPASGFALVGYTTSQGTIAIPKMKDPGWVVEASRPGELEMNGGIYTAEEAILITSQVTPPVPNRVTTWASLNFEDPDSRGGTNTYPDSNPFPLGVTGVDDNHFAIRATGTVIITTAGEYRFGFQGDDGGYLTIKGGPSGSPAPFWKSIVSTTGNGVIVDETDHDGGAIIGTQNRFQFEGGTGNSRTIASIDLQPGEYTLQGLFMDNTGGAFWEVFAAQTFDSPSFTYPLLQFGGATSAGIGSSFPVIAPVVVPVSGPFNITNFATTGTPISGATFNFSSAETGSYAVQVSTDLANWSTITAPVTVNGGVSSVTADFTGQTVNGQPIIGQPKLFIRVVRTF